MLGHGAGKWMGPIVYTCKLSDVQIIMWINASTYLQMVNNDTWYHYIDDEDRNLAYKRMVLEGVTNGALK